MYQLILDYYQGEKSHSWLALGLGGLFLISMPEAVQHRKTSQEFLFNALDGIIPTAQEIPRRNIDLVKRFINEVVNGGNFDMVDELWAKDMKWHGGSLGLVEGIENYKSMLTASVDGSFADMHLNMIDIVADGDKVVLYFTNSGRHVGDFMGQKATGKSAEWYGMGIYRIENGKIAEAWFSEDTLDMFRQLNITQIPGDQ